MAGPPLVTASAIELPSDAVEVARVLDAWGVKGWIRVQPLARPPQALFSSRQWFACAPNGPLAAGKHHDERVWPRLLRITSVREQGSDVLAALRDVDDRTAAEALRGARIFVPRSSFPSVGEDEFYWVDLLGMQVINRQQEALGTVAGLIDTGVHSVLRVAPAAQAAPSEGSRAALSAEILIPFVAAYIDQVDRGSGQIRVDWGADY